MFEKLTQFVDLPARGFLSTIFIMSGLGKIGAYAGTQIYLEAFGLPGQLLAPTIAFEIGAGILLLVGLGTRYVALLLAGFTLMTALVFHRDFTDQIQQIMFLKNVAMAGGFILLAKTGAPGVSVDGALAARKAAAS